MSILIAVLALAVACLALRTARRANRSAEMNASLNTRFMRSVNQTLASHSAIDQLQDEIEKRRRAGGPDPFRIVHDEKPTETDARWPDLEMPEA